MSNQYELFSISNDKYAPTGDQNVNYPQLCIRTNRTAERSNLNEVIIVADSVANQFPPDDKDNRAKAVIKTLTELLGGGGFGHAWIIFFNSAKKGDCTTYAYHEKYGFVKNGNASDRNDSPERRFHLQRTVPLTDLDKQPAALERTIIPQLNRESYAVANIMGMEVKDPVNGAYTPINNCSWFAGKLWNYASGEQLIFEQDFDGAAHADNWGMPFLSLIKKVADPGMIAESLDA
ncbi:hypothetical protein [Yersinia aleksiciae]|uniref:Uncharacterized protein n=1 Tax=Yersinia aleksiciae TaxID=263819 RepID=A0A0T9T786_YERAE|nr:hypothetical protein [Yersinia aleksiciae]MDA5498290.1 hypothetical protein [Yersinia aleksiciae]NIK99224.1 hypothetical protein [Yersinia aleksiciae]WQC72607.1 hypothetical protein N0K21_09500 [Yersinia aleksiciae]CFQ45435.1 Uncharacterised protein [Yersinia aleksiciae]CNK65840.1 Uncharacterised protein [Yersinia aleksiciae]